MTKIGERSLASIYAPIEKELAEFNGALRSQLNSNDGLIASIHEHLLKMTGKALRPALAIFASKIGPKPRSADVIRLAVAVELIHTATLVHDDIIDDSELRRNQPTLYSKWGTEISIVSGDYLYAKAFLALASLKDLWVYEAFAACAHLICEGEMKQIEKRANFVMSEEDYLKIIHQKTAALFQASAMGGAYFAGSGPEQVRALGDYGYALGMAFQIVDDCLDIVGETESLGKTSGLDIYKSDVTLPVLYLFHGLKEPERAALLAEIRQSKNGVFEKMKARILETRSYDRAMEKARTFIDSAHQALRGIADSPYKESLTNLAHHCLDRVR